MIRIFKVLNVSSIPDTFTTDTVQKVDSHMLIMVKSLHITIKFHTYTSYTFIYMYRYHMYTYIRVCVSLLTGFIISCFISCHYYVQSKYSSYSSPPRVWTGTQLAQSSRRIFSFRLFFLYLYKTQSGRTDNLETSSLIPIRQFLGKQY